jgi:hypothetical protein
MYKREDTNDEVVRYIIRKWGKKNDKATRSFIKDLVYVMFNYHLEHFIKALYEVNNIVADLSEKNKKNS